MISRSSIPKQISKGDKMPQGKGTYGSKIGRPPKKIMKYDTGGSVKPKQSSRSDKKKTKSKLQSKFGSAQTPVSMFDKGPNVPGEKQRQWEGAFRAAEASFKQLKKLIKAKRSPHKG